MLTLEQKKNLFAQLCDAITEEDANKISALLRDVSPADQVWLLTVQSPSGSLPFYAATLSKDETFLALVENLPHSDYVKVFKVLKDGDTPLTSALDWGRGSRVEKLLLQVDEQTFLDLLNTKNSIGHSLTRLLLGYEDRLTSQNLYEKIDKIRKSRVAATLAKENAAFIRETCAGKSNRFASNYFVTRASSRFGGKQAEYVREVSNIVLEIKEKIQKSLEDNADVPAFFDGLLEELGDIRHRIALSHQPEKAESFGRLRPITRSIHTGLFDVYEEYQQKLLLILQSHIQAIFDEEQERISVALGSYHGIDSRMEVQRLNVANKEAWTDSIAAVTREIEERVRTMAPQFETCISDWLLFTIYEENRPLSQYLTYVERSSPRVAPLGGYLKAMQYRSLVYILHQNSHVNDALTEIAHLFEQAIRWDRADQQELIDIMAQINYKWAHAMPYIRGSAAIMEWIEQAVYAFHDLDVQYVKDKSINMEALTNSWPEFAHSYDTELIQLESSSALRNAR